VPSVAYAGPKARADNADRIQIEDGGKTYLLVKNAEPQDLPASLVKRLKSDEFSGHNFDFGSADKE
jgi:hypothetical protein